MGPLGQKAGEWWWGGGVRALTTCPRREGPALWPGRERPLEVAGCAAGIQRWGGGAGEAWSRAVLCCQGGWLEPQPSLSSTFPEGPGACQAGPHACPEPMAT